MLSGAARIEDCLATMNADSSMRHHSTPIAVAAPRRGRHSRMSALRSLLTCTATLGLVGCPSGEDGLEPIVTSNTTFAPVQAGDALQAAEVERIIESAALAIDAPFMSVAVVDRIGNLVGLWNRNLGSDAADLDNSIAVSLARTAAFLSHSQAPLTSRTGQFISTFHFPSRFDEGAFLPASDPRLAPLRPTSGVSNTPQGPLWQIDASNRGADFGIPALPFLANPDGTVPSPGFTALPGAIPLYKTTAAAIADPAVATVGRRCVGGVGVYVTDAAAGVGTPDPEASEFAALNGVLAAADAPNPTPSNFTFFPAVPFTGAVYLVGILLPAVNQTERPAGYGPGSFTSGVGFVPFDDPNIAGPGGLNLASRNGTPDADGDLIGPIDSVDPAPGAGGFTAAELQVIVDETVRAARATHAAIRLPADAPTSMVIAITDLEGNIIALHRMPDATIFSVDIAITKARNTTYYSNANSLADYGDGLGQRHPLDGIVPPGTAITCRTLGFLTQPFFPPGIDGTDPGPLFDTVQANRNPDNFDGLAFSVDQGEIHSGLIVFPGSAPLYRDGMLVGGIGVSGDGVEQDDFVTNEGIKEAERILGFDLEPPSSIRVDNFEFEGIRLPYFKFPQNPGG